MREHTEEFSTLEFVARSAPKSWVITSSRSSTMASTRADLRVCDGASATGLDGVEVEKKPSLVHPRRQRQNLLRRVFGLTLTCATCGIGMKINAVITEDELIHKIKRGRIDPRDGPFSDEEAQGTHNPC
jgi:hypothetical protein